MESQQPRILIAGAGIGGLALAIALQRNGMTPVIWEKARALREIGAGLLLTPNAVGAIKRLGLFDLTCRAGMVVNRWEILNRSGRVLQTFHQDRELPSISVARSAFQQLLLAGCPPETVRLGHEVRDLMQAATDGSVAVTSAHGATFAADLVVGADGGNSTVRAAVESSTMPRVLGYVGWRGLVNRVPGGWESGRITESWGDGGRFGIAAVSAERTYWYATENAAAGWSMPVEKRKAHLLRRFQNWHAPVCELIAATEDSDILLSPISEHRRLRSWHRDSVTLLGDAAHLMTPNLGPGGGDGLGGRMGPCRMPPGARLRRRGAPPLRKTPEAQGLAHRLAVAPDRPAHSAPASGDHDGTGRRAAADSGLARRVHAGSGFQFSRVIARAIHSDAMTASANHFPSLDELGRDLLHVLVLRRAVSLVVPFVLAALFFVFAARGLWIPALACPVALSFLTYGSTSHDLVHRTLRLPPWLNEPLLCAVELICLRSGHAYRVTHLHHHARFPAEDDLEAASARMPLRRALFDGVTLQCRLFFFALGKRGPHRAWVRCEGVAIIVLLAGAAACLPWTLLPAIYCSLMIAGSWVFPIVTVLIPHDAGGEREWTQTRLFRGRVLSLLAFGHLYHLEHHLYPQVPHHNWPELARRLDPHFARLGVRPIKLFF